MSAVDFDDRSGGALVRDRTWSRRRYVSPRVRRSLPGADPFRCASVEAPRRTAEAARERAQALGWLIDRASSSELQLGSDLLMLALASLAALGAAAPGLVSSQAVLVLAAYAPIAALLLHLRRPAARLSWSVRDHLGPIVSRPAIAAMTILGVGALTGEAPVPEPVLARVWLLSILFLLAGRTGLSAAASEARRRGLVRKRTIIVGAGTVGANVARRLNDHPECGLRPIGFIDVDPAHGDEEHLSAPFLGMPEDLGPAIEVTRAEHVIFAFSSVPDSTLVPLVNECARRHVAVSLIPRLFDSINERIALDRVGPLPVLRLQAVDPAGVQFALKHALDRVVAALALLVLAPLFALVAVAIKVTSPGPVFFQQRRIGRDGAEFDMVKFRSMSGSAAPPRAAFHPLDDIAPGGVEGDDRRTRLGRWLRRTSLDELPQLVNVLRGEMSLVGPRPERPEYAELFDERVSRYTDRLRVKSGMTGLAQIHGLRGQTSLARRVEWDNCYIENWSLSLDLWIIAATIRALCQGPREA